MRSLRSHAMTSGTWDRHRGHAPGYDVVGVGYNYRMDEPRAALLTARLTGLEDDIATRRALVHRYRELLRRRARRDRPLRGRRGRRLVLLRDARDRRGPRAARPAAGVHARGAQGPDQRPVPGDPRAQRLRGARAASCRAASSSGARSSRCPSSPRSRRATRIACCPRSPTACAPSAARAPPPAAEPWPRRPCVRGRASAAAIIERSPGLVPTALACAALLWFARRRGRLQGHDLDAGDAAARRGAGGLPGRAAAPAAVARRPWRPCCCSAAYGLWSLLSIAVGRPAGPGLGRRQPHAALRDRAGPLLALAAARRRGRGRAGRLRARRRRRSRWSSCCKVAGRRAGRSSTSTRRASREPVGYANANVALWMLGLIPCAILAGRRGLPAPLRGLFLGAACLLAGAAAAGPEPRLADRAADRRR